MRSGPGLPISLPFSEIFPVDRLHVAADRLQKRRLPAARRPEQHEAIGFQYLKIDAIRRRDEMLLGLVLERHALDGKMRRGRGGVRARC